MNKILITLILTAGLCILAWEGRQGVAAPLQGSGGSSAGVVAPASTPSVGGVHTPGADIPPLITGGCKVEDDTNCYWNAKVQGNGKGDSFYALQAGDLVCIYFPDDRAKDYCTEG